MPRKNNKFTTNVLGKNVLFEEKYYLGNKALPTADSEYEFSPDMVSSYLKCMDDIKYFAENFFTIIAAGKRMRIPLRPYLKDFLDSMMKNDRVLFLTSRLIGKCIFCTTFIKVKILGIPMTLKVKWLWRFLKIVEWLKKHQKQGKNLSNLSTGQKEK